MRTYYVYILSSNTGTLYIGVTNSLERRIFEHKNKLIEGFTKKYNIDRLIYYEEFLDVNEAIRREKELKGWLRRKKLALVWTKNPKFIDLSEDWWN